MRSEERKVLTGVVLSNKMQKTVVVMVERSYSHPFFKKVVKASKKYKAHDEENKCNVGDVVEMMETRPISRDKRWRVTKVIDHGKVIRHDLPARKQKAIKEEGESA